MSMRAYCYASGLIEFGSTVPDGAISIASGPLATLREFIEGTCRHGYQTQLVDGRPTKIPGTEQLLVPGVPEAGDQAVALTALQSYLRWIRKHKKPEGVKVL